MPDTIQGGFRWDSSGNLDVNIANSSQTTANPGMTRLQDGTTTNLAAVDSFGSLQVDVANNEPTYSAAIFGYAPPATPTDLWTIQGSTTKTIAITRIWIDGRATAATYYRLRLLKYSVLFTGGTPTAITAVPHDSANPAATAVVQGYTVLPAPGTLVGAIHDDVIVLNVATLGATSTFSATPSLVYDFGTRPSQELILRGAAQYLALNANAVAVPAGGVLDIKVEWTEG